MSRIGVQLTKKKKEVLFQKWNDAFFNRHKKEVSH